MVILTETWQNGAVTPKINRFMRKERGRWKEGEQSRPFRAPGKKKAGKGESLKLLTTGI